MELRDLIIATCAVVGWEIGGYLRRKRRNVRKSRVVQEEVQAEIPIKPTALKPTKGDDTALRFMDDNQRLQYCLVNYTMRTIGDHIGMSQGALTLRLKNDNWRKNESALLFKLSKDINNGVDLGLVKRRTAKQADFGKYKEILNRK